MRDVTELTPLEAERRVAYGNDPNQFLDIWSSPNARATVAFIHGGFWRAKYDLNHASFLCKALRDDGFNVANIEYRRVGNAGGGWPGTFDDIRTASQRVKQEFSGTTLIVCGHSAGGHLALRLAGEDAEIAGVIALAPVSVLTMAYQLHLSNDAVAEFLGGTPKQIPKRYEEACPSYHPLLTPVTIIHGCDDDVVPISMSREFLRLRMGNKIRFVELELTGHMELIDPSHEAFVPLRAAISEMV